MDGGGRRRRHASAAAAHGWRQMHAGHARLGGDMRRRFYASRADVRRLGLKATLEGHNGCVNCLQWNESGTLLASGSDDHSVILWDALRAKRVHSIDTGHTNNIFAVQFMPHTGDRVIATGAGDSAVRVCDVTRATAGQSCCVRLYSCHAGRVKRLATAKAGANMLWSAAEDACLMQHDTREPSRCDPSSAGSRCPHVLLNLAAHCGADCELKSIAFNPAREEVFAVAATDPFVRLFDRRYLRQCAVEYSLRPADRLDNGHALFWQSAGAMRQPQVNCLPEHCYDFDTRRTRYFCAGHLNSKCANSGQRAITATHVSFSPRGNELLVNLGGEQIYLFDMDATRGTVTLMAELAHFLGSASADCINGVAARSNGHCGSKGHSVARPTAAAGGGERSQVAPPPWCKALLTVLGGGGAQTAAGAKRPLEPHAEQLKAYGNGQFERKDYCGAIGAYSRAILCAHGGSALLHANRAAAYMKRNWDGDIYAALRDCDRALGLEPGHVKALFRLARCLHLLQRHNEALIALAIFTELYAGESSSAACVALKRDIERARAAPASQGALHAHQSDASSEHSRRTGRKRSASAASSSAGQAAQQQQQHEHAAHGDANEAGEHGRAATEHNASQSTSSALSELESEMRMRSEDYAQRFCGHCNTTTDIKEASFIGDDGAWICAGSDDGLFFIWDRGTGEIESVLRGDQSIVNCLQPHPSTFMLATSGIESVVKLWQPTAHEADGGELRVDDVGPCVAANQRRMAADPFEVMLYNIGFRLQAAGATGASAMGDADAARPRAAAAAAQRDQDDEEEGERDAVVQCRQS